jgi:hypothetical protein
VLHDLLDFPEKVRVTEDISQFHVFPPPLSIARHLAGPAKRKVKIGQRKAVVFRAEAAQTPHGRALFGRGCQEKAPCSVALSPNPAAELMQL